MEKAVYFGIMHKTNRFSDENLIHLMRKPRD